MGGKIINRDTIKGQVIRNFANASGTDENGINENQNQEDDLGLCENDRGAFAPGFQEIAQT